MNINDKAKEFYELLLKEETALVKLDLDLLSKIRESKSEYLNLFESALRNTNDLNELDKELLNKIRKKNLKLANLYKFSISLFKKESNYGDLSVPVLNIKA